MKIRANGLDLEVEVHGPADGTPVLLIMGLGMQLVAWPPALIDALTAAGMRVVIYDNRDIGLSDKFDHWGRPNMVKVTMQYTFGLHIDAPYRLGDMAQDALGILDALGIARAHVVGVSMGGMIAQILAADHADRLSSAAFVMTSTGSRLLPGPSVRARTALLSRPKSREFDDLVEHGMHVWRVIGSPAYPPDDAALRDRVGLAMRRSWHPQGMARQLVAISASQERSELVRRIGVPSLVIHGRADPLVPVGCGIDLAKRIPGAALELYDGMGHDLPAALVPRLAQCLLGHFARAA